MIWMRLLGGLAALLVVVTAVGSLAGLGSVLADNAAAAVVVGLLLALVFALLGYGSRFDTGSSYW